jgi:CHAT domain-containing protein
MQQFTEWINLSDLEASRAYLRAHPALLSDAADRLLEELFPAYTAARPDSMEELRRLLQAARERGVDAAYDEFFPERPPADRKHRLDGLPPELRQLVEDLLDLVTRDVNPGRQVVLGQQILELDEAGPVLEPALRATVLVILASALQALAHEIAGAQAERLLEQAIAACEMAVQVLPPTSREYALAQGERSGALRALAERLTGFAAIIRLEQAIEAAEVALGIFSPTSREYALSQAERGNALHELAERLSGPEAIARLEQAIAAHDSALGIFANGTSDYARSQMDKGNALATLATLLSGAEATARLEQAIEAYDIALGIFDPSSPEYARTQMNRGTGLRRLAERQGRVEANAQLEQAIEAYDIALGIFDPTSPEYARTQMNRGNALLMLAQGRYGTNEAISGLEQAIAAFDIALGIFAPTTPDYARTLLNKGNALSTLAERLNGRQATLRLEQAIETYDNALRLYASGTFDHARAQLNKGSALDMLAQRLDEAEAIAVLEQAIEAYKIAAEGFDRDVVPQWHRVGAHRLAAARLALSRRIEDRARAGMVLDTALEAAQSGLAAARTLERLAPSREFREAEWAENASLFTLAAVIQARRNEVGEAIKLLEEGRAKGLAEALGRRRADLTLLTDGERAEYLVAVDAVLELEARGRTGEEPPVELATEARAANARLEEVVKRLQAAHPDFLPEREVTANLLAAGLRRGEVLVYLVPTSSGTLLLALARSGEIRQERLDELTSDAIFDLAVQPDAQGYNRLGFLSAAVGLRNTTPLDRALDDLLPELGDRLMRSVVGVARGMGAWRAVLVAGGMLSVLPLHAATYAPLAAEDMTTAPGGRRYACDDLAITYAPSGDLLVSVRETRAKRERQGKPSRGFVVGNPKLTPAGAAWTAETRSYLRYAQDEASAIAELMRTAGMEVDLKVGAEANGEAILTGLNQADVAHLAMHAAFDSNNPLNSALLVAPGDRLSLRDLLDAQNVSLARLRLAVLSACQTGIGDFRRLREEAVGLFGALLSGGAMGVVGSLWSVDDYATKLVMEACMRRYLLGGLEPALALRNAVRAYRGLADELPLPDDAELVATPDAPATVAREHAAMQREWAAAQAAEPVESQRDGGADNGVGLADERWAPLDGQRGPARSRGIPRNHPFYWAAFVYHGA